MSPREAAELRLRAGRGRLVALAAACVVVTGMGAAIVALNTDNLPILLLGVGVIGLFGVGGGISLVTQFRSATVRADGSGIRVARIGLIPWSEVETIGTTRAGELGIRVRRPDRIRPDREESRRLRAASGGFDLAFSARDLGTTAADASQALRALQRRNDSAVTPEG